MYPATACDMEQRAITTRKYLELNSDHVGKNLFQNRVWVASDAGGSVAASQLQLKFLLAFLKTSR